MDVLMDAIALTSRVVMHESVELLRWVIIAIGYVPFLLSVLPFAAIATIVSPAKKAAIDRAIDTISADPLFGVSILVWAGILALSVGNILLNEERHLLCPRAADEPAAQQKKKKQSKRAHKE